jgi:gas vesicle protein
MSKNSKYVKGGIIGVIVGAISGLLFAPKSGKETREDIKEVANKAAREAEKKLKELHADMTEKTAMLGEKAKEVKGMASEELNELAKRAEIAKIKLGELITAVRDGQLDEVDYKNTTDKTSKLSQEIKKKLSPKKK